MICTSPCGDRAEYVFVCTPQIGKWDALCIYSVECSVNIYMSIHTQIALCFAYAAHTLTSVLCCAVLCCAVLCAMLCCALLCCAVLCCAVLCCMRPVCVCAGVFGRLQLGGDGLPFLVHRHRGRGRHCAEYDSGSVGTCASHTLQLHCCLSVVVCTFASLYFAVFQEAELSIVFVVSSYFFVFY